MSNKAVATSVVPNQTDSTTAMATQPFLNNLSLTGTAASSNNDSTKNISNPKDASNGAISKSGRSSRPPGGNGRRRKGNNFNINNKGASGRNEFPSGRRQNCARGNYNLKTPPAAGTPQGDGGASIAPSDEFEAGSVFNSGSKKQNISHLLNFRFEPRGTNKVDRSGGWIHGHQGHRRDAAPRPKYIKEQYLQANCQFVVKSNHDYSRHLEDPDLLVDWDLIEEVNLKTTSNVPSCPICLYPPRAAKITRCGHVFCWTCMLHYLSLGDEEWRKCPICFEKVYRNDLKSVVSVPWKEITIGDEIEFSLMRRERNSLFATSVDEYSPDINGRHPSIEDVSKSYSQIVLATHEQVASTILAREYKELLMIGEELGEDPTICYVEEAMKYLSERKVITSVFPSDEPRKEEKVILPSKAEMDVKKVRHVSSGSSSQGSSIIEEDEIEDEEAVKAEDLDISLFQTATVGGTKCKNKVPKETFYFYQSSDGQPIFLHALNVEMLIAEHGSFENCPKKIKGKILEKDSASMSLELRNKLRYLRHVPVTCTFEVAEIKISKDLVSKEVMDKFVGQIEQRQRTRNRRAKNEKRREKKIKVQEEKMMGRYPGAKNLKIDSEVHFPKVGENKDDSVFVDRRVSESSSVSLESGAGCPENSFADMLRQGKPRPQKPLMMTRSETFPQIQQRRDSDSEPEPEGYVPPPSLQTIGDALASALETQMSVQPPSGSKKKGKRMKGKTINLFASSRPAF